MVQSLLFNRSTPYVQLTTCTRTEIYWVADDETLANAPTQPAIAPETARHLFRVAAGLESPLLGESAIVGQVKTAYETARANHDLPAPLNRLFQTAIHVAHRVRSETGIGQGAMSHSQVTVDVLRDLNIDLSRAVISIIGINSVTEGILNFLAARHATNLILSNRHLDKAQALATKYNARAMPLDEGKDCLLQVSDIIISATSAPHSIIHKDDFMANDNRPQLLFDLAFPRDIDADVATLPGKTIYNLERVEALAQQNIEARRREIPKCEAIIEEEVANLMRWQRFRSGS